jgi:hypothetical protein
MKSAVAAERIAASLPGVRLVATLRDPIDRAYSGYLHSLREAVERRGVDEAMRPGSRYVDQGCITRCSHVTSNGSIAAGSK